MIDNIVCEERFTSFVFVVSSENYSVKNVTKIA